MWTLAVDQRIKRPVQWTYNSHAPCNAAQRALSRVISWMHWFYAFMTISWHQIVSWYQIFKGVKNFSWLYYWLPLLWKCKFSWAGSMKFRWNLMWIPRKNLFNFIEIWLVVYMWSNICMSSNIYHRWCMLIGGGYFERL